MMFNQAFATVLSSILIAGGAGVGIVHHQYTNHVNVINQQNASKRRGLHHLRMVIPKTNYKTVKQNIDVDNNIKNTTNTHKPKKLPNVNKAISSTRKDIETGLNLAFNHSQNNRLYKKNEGKMLESFGLEIGSKVNKVVKPQITTPYKHPIGMSKKIINQYVGFGKLDKNDYLPVSIVIIYETPKISNSAGQGRGATNKGTTHTGYFVLNAKLNITNDDVEIQDSDNTIKGY